MGDGAMTQQSRLQHGTGTVAERTEAGREARKRVPRRSHGDPVTSAERRDPVEVLDEQAATRVPELVPIRYGRMASSPFAFFRGAAAVMSMDLADSPTSGFTVQLCGDAHLVNFGVYNSPERRLVFDLNDFDETLPGPWEWDLKRLTASVAVASYDNGFSEADAAKVVQAAALAYSEAMTSFAGMSNLQVWYARLEVDALVERARVQLSAARAKRIVKQSGKIAMRDNLQAFSKLTVMVDGRPRFASAPPLIVPIEELAGAAGAESVRNLAHVILDAYRASLEDDRKQLAEQYVYEDLARKVVGVGSVGTRAWVALMLGRDETDPLMLQFKEAQTSVLEPYLGASEYSQHGHRVVGGQRLMQASSDIFLGWFRTVGLDGVERDFYGRQLRDGKGSVDIALMDVATLSAYVAACGWTLARAHARSGDRVAIASYLGGGKTFAAALSDYALAYAEQNSRDHAALVAAVASGRLEAVSGV
jgi:uncharacterized protein (DUF2252 family)